MRKPAIIYKPANETELGAVRGKISAVLSDKISETDTKVTNLAKEVAE